MKSLNKLLYKWIDKQFLGGCSSYNSLAVRKSCRSKFQAREAFKKHNIPYAKGAIFYSPFSAHSFAKQHGFPLVIKPNVSGFSRGSYFPITNFIDLWKAAFLAKIWWPASVVEQYLEGKNYRVVVIKDQIMSVIRRYPPFVDGDGTSTISELIDKENAQRQSMKLYPVVNPIPKNMKVIRYIRKKGITLASVPEKNERITLNNRISLAPGGIVETIPKETMAPDNREIFLKILTFFDANIFGIDAIFERGIDTSYKEQNCIFLEVNSRPYLKMHHYPRFGKKEDLSEFYNQLETIEIENSDIF